MHPIIDLHCDLMVYLAGDPKRSPTDLQARCSFPQLKEGNIAVQTCAFFSFTQKGSSVSCLKQFYCFQNLEEEEVVRLKNRSITMSEKRVQLFYSIENGSGLVEEDEPLDLAFTRLEKMEKEAGKPLYISFTWNDENRFGGGNFTQKVGLKEDGKALLEYLDGKGVFIDLSHTSDRLATGIFEHIDKKGLKLTPIASHSNFRKIANQPRNLPDEIALEIKKRGGVIGLNLVRKFIGMPFEEHLVMQLEYARKLDLLQNLVFGADFFYDGDGTPDPALLPFFEKGFDDASCYPKIVKKFQKVLSEKELEGLCCNNFLGFLKRQT